MKSQTFNRIIKAKNLNKSACDRMKNLNTRSEIIGRVINERTDICKEEEMIVLDDYFKCTWYGYYKFFTTQELQDMYGAIYREYVLLDKSVRNRGKYILKLRGNKWSI